jgi:hypothetical protein
MSTGRLISGLALVHSWPSKEARLRDGFRVADHTSGNVPGTDAFLLGFCCLKSLCFAWRFQSSLPRPMRWVSGGKASATQQLLEAQNK